MKDPRNLFLALWTAIVAGIAIYSCSLPYHLPTRMVPDTRVAAGVVFTQQANQQVFGMLDSMVQTPDHYESGRCLYGKPVWVDSAHSYISVEYLSIPQQPDSATPVSIYVICENTQHGLSLVGDAHTHPPAKNPYEFCGPSEYDFLGLLTDDRILVSYIYCANGLAYRQMKDGRWQEFVWRQPAPTVGS